MGIDGKGWFNCRSLQPLHRSVSKVFQPPGVQIYGTYPRLQRGSPEHEEGEASRAIAVSATLALEILAPFPSIISITLKNNPNNSRSRIKRV